jgi:hypothetical protein
MCSALTWRVVARASWSNSTRKGSPSTPFNKANSHFRVLESDDKLDQSAID